MLVDSHCHLQDRQFDSDREQVLARATAAGVSAIVVAGDDIASSRRAIDLADSYENVYAAIGVHPHNASAVTPREIETLGRLADSAKVVAIGEIGLDFYRELSPRAVQRAAFQQQLELARSLHLPVVIHSRDADEETFGMIEEYEQAALPKWPKDRPLGVLHCFAGDLALALRYIELGFVISIPGACTYPNAGRTRTVARGIPYRWLTVETDAPYLPPQPRRGGRNEPAYLTDTVQCIADLRGDSVQEVADRTAMTAAWLFGLGNIGEPTAQTPGDLP
ncbi:MAG: TatD family hydrolase [Dehalococcoidia bacterium]|nr:TatD family hydrolase [Dehalococcoidia bacterium]